MLSAASVGPQHLTPIPCTTQWEFQQNFRSSQVKGPHNLGRGLAMCGDKMSPRMRCLACSVKATWRTHRFTKVDVMVCRKEKGFGVRHPVKKVAQSCSPHPPKWGLVNFSGKAQIGPVGRTVSVIMTQLCHRKWSQTTCK